MNPLYIIGAVLGTLSIIFIVAYASIKNKKEVLGFDRNMSDTIIIKRLLGYAKKHYKSFIIVFLLILEVQQQILYQLKMEKNVQ